MPGITFETNYLIWDNAAREVIAWGTIDSDRVINLSRIIEIYDQLILDSFQRMARHSPFTPQRG